MGQEQHLSEKPPEILGVAVILPYPKKWSRSVEGMETDPEIERIAVRKAMEYEREQKRKPVSVEEENCGWDVTSLQDGQVCSIHRSRGAEPGSAVSPFRIGRTRPSDFGRDYGLSVVVNWRKKPELHLIQDPASKLNPKEEVSVVRYMVGLGDWKQAACMAHGREP